MDNFFRLWGKSRREATGTQTASNDASSVAGGSYDERIVRVTSPDKALTIAAVHRAVELRMKTEGQFLPQLQRLNREGGNFVPDIASPSGSYISNGHRLNYLLQMQPNPLMTSIEFIEGLVYHRLMLGNGIAYIERNEYRDPVAIWLCSTAGYNPLSATYNLTYQGVGGAKMIESVPARDVIHWKNTYKTFDGLWGIPTLRYAIDTLNLVKTEQQQALESAAKGGRVKLLIGEQTQGNMSPIASGRFDPSQAKAYAQEINQDIYKQDVVALQNLDKVQQISMSAQEMQMVEMMNLGVDDVARFYATPRPLLMADTNSHYTTYVNARMEYLSNTIQPEIVELEQEFGRKLLTLEDFGKRRFHMCEQPVMRLDKEAQAKVDQMRLATGTATPNELRKQYDMPAVDGGDEPLAAANLMTLKALIAKAEPTPMPEPEKEPGKEGGES